MKTKGYIIMVLLVLLCCQPQQASALANQGKVMMSSQTAGGHKRKTKMFVLDNEDHFFNRCCDVVDIWFDWMGFHEIP